MPVVTNWAEAVDGVLTDLLRFASYRSIGVTPPEIAPRMQITMRLAEHYEALITHLMADPECAGPVPPAALPAGLLPEHEQQVREQVARQIEDRGKNFGPRHPVRPYVETFARIARGES